MKTEIKNVKHSLAKKLLICLFSISFIVGIILASFYYYYTKQYIWSLYSKITTSCALDVSNMLYGAPLDKFLLNEEQDLYKKHLRSVRNIAQTFRLKYLYVYVPDTENDRLVAIFGIDGANGKIIKDFGLGESPENLRLNQENMKMFYQKAKKWSLELDNEYGHVITGYSTVLDKNNNPIAIAGADIDFKYMQRRLNKDFSITFIVIFFTLFLISLFVLYFANRLFIKPILLLSANMQKSLNEKKDNVSVEINTDDEFNVIASAYNLMAYEKERLANELKLAHSIQTSTLPMVFPPYPDNKLFDIYANMTPAKEVGGDFYDFYFIGPTQFMFLIADVSGKGIPAALFMMTTKTLIESWAPMRYHPKVLIEKINNEICKNNKEGFFVTLFAAIIDVFTGEIHYINCGHNPPVIKKKNKKFEYLDIGSNIALGAIENMEYNIVTTTFEADDLILLYTDGVTEAETNNQKQYGTTRLLDCLNNIKDNDVTNIINEVKNDVKIYTGDAEQSDDMTMLCFKYTNKAI